jgi:Uma2 family endonuclease
VLMVESARLCTADDLAAMPEDGLRYVLVRGKLIAVPLASDIQSEVALMLSLLIDNFVRANNLGWLYAAETGFKLTSDPDTVLAADFAFVSPSNTRLELQEKIALYFRAGTRQVWIVYPRARAVYVYIAEDQVTIHTGESVIESGDLLPNFRLPISQIFAVLV